MHNRPCCFARRTLPAWLVTSLWLAAAQAQTGTPALPEADPGAKARQQAEQNRISAINRVESPDGPALPEPPTGSELTGVMVDRTVTMAGKTFYRAFSRLAMGNPIIGNATITFRERPDARWGSQLWILEGNRVYFRTQLSPRINEADRAAEQAVQTVEEALLRRRLEAAITSDKDLGSEELF